MTRHKAMLTIGLPRHLTHKNRKNRKRLRRALRKVAPERFDWEERRGNNP